MTERIVHVIGAGVAGLSAAVRLVDAGLSVVVHEAARAAGGRCRSYYDQSLDLVIDNGNHLLLSGNHAALDYLGRIGSLDKLRGPSSAIFDFADVRSGERWRLRPNEGRVPWWLLDRRRRAPGTTLSEYFAPLGMLTAPSTATVADAISCTGPLYERLWRPVLLAGLNTDPREGSAALAAAILRETLAAGGRACRPLIASEGLSPTFIDPALAFLKMRNATVRFGERLRAIRFESARAAELEFEAGRKGLAGDDAVVIAVPPRMAQDLLPGLEAPDEFRAIVNAHFRITPPQGQPPTPGRRQRIDRVAVRLSGTSVDDDQRRRPAARPTAGGARGRDLARGGGTDRSPTGYAALADRQGEARDLRRDAGAERQAPSLAHSLGQCRACRRLDADRPARNHRRRGSFRL